MQQRAEVNIDDYVDYKAEYSAVIKKAKISGDNLTGLCPFHEDRNNSFSVDLKTGLWHCFSEDRGGNFIDFYAELHGCSTGDAYKEILRKYNVPDPEDEKPKGPEPYSVAQYALEKRLPREFLEDPNGCCLRTVSGHHKGDPSYMEIPYFDENHEKIVFRKRYGHKDFRWGYGSSGKIGLYGEWYLSQIRKTGYAALVEGESDSQSMWCMGISCLGVPGASMFKEKHVKLLEGLRIYIHQEQDQGGETFLRKVVQALQSAQFPGKVYKWTCGHIEGCKDPSDVWMKFGKKEAAEKILQLISHAEEVDLSAPAQALVPDYIQDAPVKLRFPEGYEFTEKGIFRITKSGDERLICRTPILLSKRLKSMDTGEEKIEIAFKRDARWQQAIFPRSTIFTARGITVLSDLGCTVTSENAKDLVRYLSALESENIDLIEKAAATSRLGWQEGKKFIPGIEDGVVLDADPAQQSIIDAYRCQRGSLDGWIEYMEPFRERDKFRFIMAASFTAPLLRIIQQRIFFVYNWGSSKGGKSAALKAALSAWGDPDRLMMNFNATQVGLERTAALFCDLPLGIDERQLAGRNQDSLENTVYMIASGTGKTRGTKNGGLQKTRQWRTVAIATGEEPISTETSQTGVSTRTIEIYGGPFKTEKEASEMHQNAPKNCGWAGQEFVKKLIQAKEGSVREKYDEMLEFVSGLLEGKSGAHAACIAAVALADTMLDSWVFKKLPAIDAEGNVLLDEKSWLRSEKMAEMILGEQLRNQIGDVNENATQFLVDWVIANSSYFGEKTIGTCLGDMSEEGNIAWILPSAFNKALKDAGFSPRKTLRYLADNDLITTIPRSDNSGQTYQVTKRFNNRVVRFIEFKIGKLSEAGDPIEAVADDSEKEDGFVPIPDGLQEELPFV